MKATPNSCPTLWNCAGVFFAGRAVGYDAVLGFGFVGTVNDQVVNHAAVVVEQSGIKALPTKASLATSLAINLRKKALAFAPATSVTSIWDTSNIPASVRTARVRRFVNHNGWAAPSRQNLPASRLHLDGLDEMGWFSEQSFSSFSGFFVQMPPAHLCADDPICP